ncbi:arsenate reductase (glutaredoxin) [Ornithinibacter aureus]|uniref:Arsenate reductase (Glutaredoxin) n=1 Tax=Ornithinibacter aureus TaxID=622664 RepID=A0ABP8JP58_9MICO|nr:ArsC/Spx/MgsR family protein [Ornithinibacter aureus]KAF0835289.1 arsenate reductase [Ornithinibacter aureus]
MSDVTILHNRNCSTSRFATETAASAGVAADVVEYLKKPLDAAALADLLDKLEDPATDLVRRDAFFTQVGLTDADVQTREQVIAVLVQHPRLLQRPVLVKGDRAIIGRPKDRVADFLDS